MNYNEFEKAQIAYNNFQFVELDFEKVINNFKKIIINNKVDFFKIFEIDNINKDYHDIEFYLNKINTVKNVKKEIEQRKRKEDGFIVSRYKESYGVLGVLFNGNIYVTFKLLELLCKTKNVMILCTNNEKYSITNFVVLCFKQALKASGYDEEIVQVINSENYEEMFKHNNILRKLIIIGNKDLQNKVISKAKVEVVKSGYGCGDIYIENILDFQLIKKIISINEFEFNIYINKNIEQNKIKELGIENYTEIENIDECIRDININSAGFSSSIFTNSSESANKFLRLVRSKNVFVNASPALEGSLDIEEKDLLYKKQTMFKNS